MAAAPRKLCVLGAPGVGKSRLAMRLALDGDDCGAIRVGTRVLSLPVPAGQSPLRLWDGPGSTLLDSLSQPLLLHADGLLLVGDCTRPDSCSLLPWLAGQAAAVLGGRPMLVLLNKVDLAPVPTLDDQLRTLGPVLAVSATTGAGLDAARAAVLSLLGDGGAGTGGGGSGGRTTLAAPG